MDCDVLPEDNAGRKNRYQNDEDYPPCPGTEDRYRVAHRLGLSQKQNGRRGWRRGLVGIARNPDLAAEIVARFHPVMEMREAAPALRFAFV
jgi:hypothetical protein